MKIIVISNPVNINGEFEFLNQLFSLGLEYFHIRKPGFNYSDLRNYIKDIPSKYHNRIILHSHFELLNEFELKGIHIKRNDKQLLLEDLSCKKYQ